MEILDLGLREDFISLPKSMLMIVFESYCNLVSNALIHPPPFSPPLEPRKQVAFPQQQLPSMRWGSDPTPSGSLVRLVSC
jgi:hypothetical protein